MKVTPYANSLFELPWWLDIVAPGQWKECIVSDDSGAVIARMPYVISKNRVSMPKLTQTLGIWMSPETVADYGAQKKVIFEIFNQLSSYKSVSHTLSSSNEYILPFRWLGYRLEPSFTYRLNNLADCEGLYQKFNKTAKKNIKAARNKVSISDKTDIDTLWRLLDKTFEAQNRKNPMDKDLVYRIVQTCEETGHGKYPAPILFLMSRFVTISLAQVTVPSGTAVHKA